MAHNIHPGSQDAGDFQLTVTPIGSDSSEGGRVIKQFTGLTGWRIDKDPTYNEGPGGRAFGFNHMRHSNKVSFTINVRDTSPDIQYLHDLSVDETEVMVKVEAVYNLDTYQTGQEIGLGCERGVILPGSRDHGAGDSADVSFEVRGIGPIVTQKE